MNSERNNPSPEEPDQTPEEPLQGVFDLQSPDSDTPSQPVLPSREEEERAAHEATSALIRQIIEDSESGKLAQQANEKREREEERLQRQADDRRREEEADTPRKNETSQRIDPKASDETVAKFGEIAIEHLENRKDQETKSE